MAKEVRPRASLKERQIIVLDCLVAGEANVDLLVDGLIDLEPDTEKIARSMNLELEGSSAITAHNLACLGLRVGFVGIIGDDLFGRYLEATLGSSGVETGGVRRHPTAKTGITIWHSRANRRAGVTYPGTVALLRSEDVTWDMLKKARHLHVGAYFIQKGLHTGAAVLVRRAKAAGLTPSLDCNYDPPR